MQDFLHYLTITGASLVTNWRAVLEIVILALGLYSIFALLKGTRGGGILKGIGLVIIGLVLLMFLVARFLELNAIVWILEKLIAMEFIMLVIIFQPELRRIFFNIGQSPIFQKYIPNQYPVIDEIVRAVHSLSSKKTGVLIALERTTSLKSYIEGGTSINAEVSSALIGTIAYNGTPLHDGAIIIQNDRLTAAGCLLPLSTNPEIGKSLGTRHRAAVGLTEESDAIVVIVSEETGKISLSVRGHLTQGLNRESLHKILVDLGGDTEGEAGNE